MSYLEESKQREIFSKNLNERIEKLGLNQKDVAIALDVAPTTFNTWAKGKSMPSVSMIRKIADYLGVGMSKLIDEQKEETKDFDFTLREMDLILKYRALDGEGKEMLDNTMKRAYAYANLIGEKTHDRRKDK